MVIQGTDDDDTLNGTPGDDRIIGGAGADTMVGGTGNDRYYVDNPGDREIEATGTGSDWGGYDAVITSISYTLPAGQRLEYLLPLSRKSTVGLALTGNEFGNVLYDTRGNDTLNGGAGNDRVNARLGDDMLVGGDGDDTLFAGTGADILDGGDGNDDLRGGVGTVSIAGGAGDDIYSVVDAATLVLDEAVGGGMDTIVTRHSFTLAAGLEIETLRADRNASDKILTGNEFDNALIGFGANDTLNGGGGNDRLFAGTTMSGGSGNDSFEVYRAGAVVIEEAGGGADTIYSIVSYTLAAGQEIETLRLHRYVDDGDLNLIGNEFDNTIIGGTGKNTLSGAGGDDRLDGRGGVDIMSGGAGDDVYFVDNAGDVVNEAAGGGTDTVYSSVNYTLGVGREIEILRVDGAAGLALTGNGFDNYIIGGAGSDTLAGGNGNDRLNGGAGADIMTGGAGNDIFYVDNAGDVVNEAAGGGTDTVFITVSYTLAAGQRIESLRVSGVATGLQLGGNELDNNLIGGAGNDSLAGAAGIDRLTGGKGDDSLLGGDGNDTLDGGAGNDTLIGGLGNDKLTGGVGNDIFRFDSAFGAGVSIDLISDFKPGFDTIQLDGTTHFPGFALGQLSAAGFSSGAATGPGPQIVYDQSTGALFYDSNGAGAGGAIRFATLASKPTLTASDFTIV